MADVSAIANKERTLKQKVVYTLAVFVGVAVICGLMAVFGIGAWVPFLAMVLWAIQGVKLGGKDILQEFVGIAMGLTMGYLLQHSSTLGTPALVAFVVLVLMLFIVMVNNIKPLMLFFNNYTAAFCTVGTALSYEWVIVYDYLFTLILFGLLPFIIMTLIDKKKKKA